MKDNCIFIADKTIINYLISGDHHKIEKAQLFFDYLSWRHYHKKVYMIPATFKLIKDKLNEEEDKSVIAYFENWFENGVEVIGEDSTTEEEDLISLHETLKQMSPVVFLISNSISVNGITTMNMENLETYLKDKGDFYQHIFETYYDSTGI